MECTCDCTYECDPRTFDCECNKAYKIEECSSIKHCSGKKCLIGKLVLECEDEILSVNGTCPDDTKRNMLKK